MQDKVTRYRLIIVTLKGGGGGRFQIFGNNLNKSKFCSGGN